MVVEMSTWSIILGVVLGGALLLWVLLSRSGRRGPTKSGAKLPNGSWGWPIIGETLEFAANPGAYVSSHAKRYGPVFKTSMFLQPMIVGSTPEFAKFVIGNSSLFKIAFPENQMQLTGPKAFAFKDGPEHMSIKKIIQRAINPEGLRSMVPILELIILENFESWVQQGDVAGFQVTPKMTLDTSLYIMLGVKNISSTQEGRSAVQNLKVHENAILAPPINLPGTAYNKGLKAKAALTAYFKFLLEKRKREGNTQADVLGVLSAAQEDPQAREEVKDLDDDMVADNLTFVWFASYATTRTTLTWILKFLVDNPEVALRVQAEQQEILKSKNLKNPTDARLTWEDTRKMVYTAKFFQEIQRKLSIAGAVFRKATQDVEFDGYLIPKGWGVLPINNAIHSDPAIYADPDRFNPDRFDVPPKPFTFLSFSAGTHMCPGLETVKLISLIYIHHLTTTYTFTSTEPDKGVEWSPLITPVGGYPIHFGRR